jgi:hypothetical protein
MGSIMGAGKGATLLSQRSWGLVRLLGNTVNDIVKRENY